MALQTSMTAEAHGKLPAEVREHYAQAEDGTYQLTLEGVPTSASTAPEGRSEEVQAELDALKTTIAARDEQAVKLREELAGLKQAGEKTSSLHEAALEAMRTEHQTAMEQAQAAAEKAAAQVKEFRTRNISLQKEGQSKEDQIKAAAESAAASAAKLEELQSAHDKLAEAGVTSAGDVKKMMARIEALETERDDAITRRQEAELRDAVVGAGERHGLLPEARDALVLLAQADGLRMSPEGTPIFAAADGTPKQTADGVLGPAEWVAGKAADGAAFLFRRSAGTGGQTPVAGGGAVGQPTQSEAAAFFEREKAAGRLLVK